MRMVSLLTTVLFCFSLSGLVSWHTVLVSGQVLPIRGEVIDLDSKRPLGGAEVQLLERDGSESARAVTNTRGLFEIEHPTLEPIVSVKKRGYIAVGAESSANGKLAFPLRDRAVGPSGVPQIGMRRSGSISGVVATADSRAMDAPIHVTLEGVGDKSDIRLTVKTEADGRYSFQDLAPGDYRLLAASRAKLHPPLMSDRYRPTYYPSAASVENAGTVSVDYGQSLQGVDWMIALNSSHSIAVRVNPRAPAQVRAASFSRGLFRNGRTTGKGEFVFDELPEGRYVVTAASVDDPVRFAVSTIQLNSDLAEVRLDFQLSAEVRGRIFVSQPSDATLELSIALPLTDGDAIDPVSSAATVVSADGRFAIGNLFGSRKLVLTGLPERCRVSEVLLAGEAQPDGLLKFAPGKTTQLDIKITCN
jgi:hypothetical protein